MKELKAKPDMPVWREEDGKKISLIITSAGREAIGVGEAEEGRSLLGAGSKAPPRRVEAGTGDRNAVDAERRHPRPAGRGERVAAAHGDAERPAQA
jgi:hypothetical protein